MKIITEDPNIIIPDIMENDIYSKVFIIYLEVNDHYPSCRAEFIGHIVWDSNRLQAKGAMNKGSEYDHWFHSQPTLIDVLNNIWHSLAREFNITVYILENKQDAIDFFAIHTIINKTISYYISMEIQSKFHLDNDEIYKITGWEFE